MSHGWMQTSQLVLRLDPSMGELKGEQAAAETPIEI